MGSCPQEGPGGAEREGEGIVGLGSGECLRQDVTDLPRFPVWNGTCSAKLELALLRTDKSGIVAVSNLKY